MLRKLTLFFCAALFSAQLFAAASVADFNADVNSSETTPTLTFPDTVTAGQTVWAFLCVDTALNSEPTWPGGWTSFDRENHGTVGMDSAWLEAVGDEDGTTFDVTIPSADVSSYVIFAISDAEDPGTQAPEQESTNATSGSVTFATLTPTGGEKQYLWLTVMCLEDEGIDTFSTGYGNEGQIGDEVPSNIAWAYRVALGSSESPTPAAPNGADQWASITGAVHPGEIVSSGGVIIRRRR